MNNRWLNEILIAVMLLTIAVPGYSQAAAWSVAISPEDSAYLVIVLSSDTEVASAVCSVSLYDASGKKTDSQITFKEDDGSVLRPGVYRRFVAHNVPNLRIAKAISMSCLPPLPKGVHPMMLPTPITDKNIWNEKNGTTLK